MFGNNDHNFNGNSLSVYVGPSLEVKENPCIQIYSFLLSDAYISVWDIFSIITWGRGGGGNYSRCHRSTPAKLAHVMDGHRIFEFFLKWIIIVTVVINIA